jgi:GTPase
MLEEFMDEMKKRNYEVFPISAATSKGIRELMVRAGQLVRELPDTILIEETDQVVEYTAEEEELFVIKKENRDFTVEGKWIRNLVKSVNIDSYDSLKYFQRVLKDRGVIKALEDHGIQEGDTVKVGSIEFEYVR